MVTHAMLAILGFLYETMHLCPWIADMWYFLNEILYPLLMS